MFERDPLLVSTAPSDRYFWIRNDPHPTTHSWPAGWRSIWFGCGRTVANVRRSSRVERGPRRAADARRLRHVLAFHALAYRSVSLAPRRRSSYVRTWALALRRAISLRRESA